MEHKESALSGIETEHKSMDCLELKWNTKTLDYLELKWNTIVWIVWNRNGTQRVWSLE
jgi:hypothetical protein